jgi:phage gp16-like protein
MCEDSRAACFIVIQAFGGVGEPSNTATGVSALHDHAACCVTKALASGDEAEQQAKFSGLVDLIEKV